MSDTQSPIFLFLDLETTGLDPSACSIIEVAVKAVTMDSTKLVHLDGFQYIVQSDSKTLWEPDALEFHQKNGLYEASRKSNHSTIYVRERLELFVQELSYQSCGIHLAGNTIHFDLGFLKAHWPETLTHLHYRVVDVSSFKVVGKALGLLEQEKVGKTHRAMDDVEASISELLYWIEAFREV